MAGSVPNQLPAYISLRYEENGVFDKFASEADRAATETKRRFKAAFTETEKLASDAVGRMGSEFGRIDLGVGKFREQAAQVKVYRETLAETSRVAAALAKETGDNSVRTREYLRALSEQTAEADRALRVAESQVTTYTRLQKALDGAASGNSRLAQAQREAAAGSGIPARPGPLNTRTGVDALLGGQASLDRAAASGTTLDQVLGRVASKGKAVTEALSAAADQAERAARAEAAAAAAQARAPTNPRLNLSGADALVAGQASLDRAAASGVTLEQVLGRVAGKSAAVTRAIKEQQQAEAEAAAETNRLAAAVDRLQAEVDPAVAAQQRYAAQLRVLDEALQANIIDQGRYNAIHARMSDQVNQGTTATRSAITSQGAYRVALLQSGQQLQDIGISLYSGQRAGVVFAQQLPQLAFALSGLENSANKTHATIGRFATFLSGPWGLAVGLAVGVAASLISSLLDVGEEAEKADTKTYDFTRTLDIMALKGNAAADAMKQLAAETRNAITEQGDYLNQQSTTAQQTVAGLEKRIAESRQALAVAVSKIGENPLDLVGGLYNAKNISNLQDSIKSDQAALADARTAAENANIALSQRRVTNELDASAAASNRYKEAVGLLNAERRKSVELEKSGDPLARATSTDNYVSASDYEKRLKNLQQIRDAAIKAAQEAKNQTGTLERTAFISPVSGGRQTGNFGEARSARAGVGAHAHAGVDLAVPVGTQVRAPAGGVVIEAGVVSGYGNVVFIDHGAGTITRLAHLSKISVTKGQKLDQGDVVGASGGARGAAGSGDSTGPHLHYEVRRNGKAINPNTAGGVPIDALGAATKAERLQEQQQRKAEAAAEKLKREQEELARFGDRAAESVARTNERFNEQPRLVDQANAATRQLDATIKELSERKPIGFEQIIKDAETAKGVVADALVRPFRDMAKDADRRLAVQGLLARGMQDEADALSDVYRMTDLLGPLTDEQEAAVRRITLAEKSRTRELQAQQALFEAQIDALDTVKSDLTSILSGRKADLFGDLKKSLADLKGKRIFEDVFGSAFRDIENELRGQSPLGKESQHLASEMNVATLALGDFTAAVKGAADARSGSGTLPAANDNGASAAFNAAFGAGSKDGPSQAFIDAFGDLGAGEAAATSTGKKPQEIARKSIKELADMFAAGIVDPLVSKLEPLFGTRLSQQLGIVAKGAISGYAQAGKVGAVLGGAQGLVESTGIFGGKGGVLSGKLGGALNGAATGSTVSGIGNALGLKMSGGGAQLGGAIGSALPIPGGDIIGAIAGGILGGLFKKSKKGYANDIRASEDGTANYSLAGNSSSRKTAAGTAADSLIKSLDDIADQFGAKLNSSLNLGSIGMKDKKYTFDPTPGNSAGRQSFDSQEEAIAAGVEYAISQGVVTGIRATTQRILKNGKDLQAALQDALTFENAFKELRAIKDPVGAAIDDLNKSFEDLIGIATRAGATQEEMAQLEELYGIKRKEIIDEKGKQTVASLKGLLDDLTIDNSALSVRDRNAAALAAYEPLKDRVAAGDKTAYDDFAQAAKSLLDIERERYGSQQGYFDRLGEVTALTKNRIDSEANVVSIASSSANPFDGTGQVKTSIEKQTDVLSSQLDALNRNLIAQPAANAAALAAVIGVKSPSIQFAGNF